jgi:hypothetical protein
VRSGSLLQLMKPKASAGKKIAAFRMSPYTRDSIHSQLCCLALTLVLLALPLAGIRIERAPILNPLATELVPLGTSLQPPISPFLIYGSRQARPGTFALGSFCSKRR